MILPFSKSSSNEALSVSSILSEEGGCFSRFDATEMVDELLLAKKEYCVNFCSFAYMADIPFLDFIELITWFSLYPYLDGIFCPPNLILFDWQEKKR